MNQSVESMLEGLFESNHDEESDVSTEDLHTLEINILKNDHAMEMVNVINGLYDKFSVQMDENVKSALTSLEDISLVERIFNKNNAMLKHIDMWKETHDQIKKEYNTLLESDKKVVVSIPNTKIAINTLAKDITLSLAKVKEFMNILLKLTRKTADNISEDDKRELNSKFNDLIKLFKDVKYLKYDKREMIFKEYVNQSGYAISDLVSGDHRTIIESSKKLKEMADTIITNSVTIGEILVRVATVIPHTVLLALPVYLIVYFGKANKREMNRRDIIGTVKTVNKFIDRYWMYVENNSMNLKKFL